MRKRRLAAGVMALAISMVTCGCSQVYELTDDEEATIVYYASHAVTKFNKKQSEGIRDVAALEKKLAEEEEEKRKQEEEEKAQQEETVTDDTQAETDPQQPDNGSGDGAEAPQQKEYVSLNQALKLGGIDAVYKKYKITPTYKETESYMVTASSGKELLVLLFDLKNNGNKAAKCNILSKMPSFRLTLNDELSVSADTTILLNDLGTYQGKIGAGDTQKAVLVFQVQEGTVKKIKGMELEVTIDGTNSLVQLNNF